MNRTMALVFKAWHVNNNWSRYYDVIPTRLSFQNQNNQYPNSYVLIHIIIIIALLQNLAAKPPLRNVFPNSLMHTWLSSSVSLVLCFHNSLGAIIDVLPLPILMWLSRLENTDEGSDWMKSVLYCVLWDYPAPGQTQIRLYFFSIFLSLSPFIIFTYLLFRSLWVSRD